ncbi:MAG: DUF6384 family protein [Planctomycetaceae bacterium]|jgi:hypothetical protein
MPSAPTSADDLSLSEMLHVLDVARALRREKETVEAELNRGEMVSALRERLLASAKATGDNVTPQEVDAAIEIYLSRLHTFAEPPFSLRKLLAYTWIWRGRLTLLLLMLLTSSVVVWWLVR